MQFSTILPIVFCLAASTLANPMALPKKNHCGDGAGAGPGAATGVVSAQVKANVSAQIDKWLGDIKSVNTFVDTVGSVTDPAVISSMAATAFVAAQNEGVSNTVLQQDVTLDASGLAAAQALIGQFNIIGPAINDTIFNPGNVQKNLDAINGARYSYLIWLCIENLFMLTVLPPDVLPLKARTPFPKKVLFRQQLPWLLVLPFLLLRRQPPVPPSPRRQTEDAGLYTVCDSSRGRRVVGVRAGNPGPRKPGPRSTH
jgi:hypothetical protein